MPFRIHLTPVALILNSFSVVFAIAVAQEGSPMLQLVEPYSESLMMSGMRAVPPASGDPTRVLVGLHLGRTSDAEFRIDHIGVFLSPNSAATDFCIRVLSGDARYVSVNAYRKASDKNSAPLVQTKSTYADELAKQYKSSEMPIRIVETVKCGKYADEDAEAPLVPAIPPGVEDVKYLVVFVNVIGSRAAVRLLDQEKILADGTCRTADDSVIIYSDVCDLPLTNLGKSHPDQLQVIFVDQSGKRVGITYRLEWMEHGH